MDTRGLSHSGSVIIAFHLCLLLVICTTLHIITRFVRPTSHPNHAYVL